METLRNFATYRSQAQHYWDTFGLPKRKFETWKHTPMTTFRMKERLETPHPHHPLFESKAAPLFFDLPNTLCTSIGSGLQINRSHFHPSIQYSRLPCDDETLNLSQYPIDYTKHPLASLIAAQAQYIDVIDIQAKQETCLHLIHVLPTSAGLSECRAWRLIRVGANARLTLIEETQGCDTPEVLINHLTLIQLEQNAELHYINLSRPQAKNPNIHGLHLWQKAASKSHVHALDLGQCALRQDVEVYLQGELAQTAVQHTLFAQGSAHQDHHVSIHHLTPKTTSSVNICAVSADQACCVSHAKVSIPAGSIDSDASQNLHHLLLSPQAKAAAEPQLEVNTDQVKCAHGATVGQLDAAALHYCLSRGISKEMAHQMLTQAFLADRFILIEQAIIRDNLENFLDQALQEYFDKK